MGRIVVLNRFLKGFGMKRYFVFAYVVFVFPGRKRLLGHEHTHQKHWQNRENLLCLYLNPGPL